MLFQFSVNRIDNIIQILNFSIYIYMLRFKFNYILKDTPYKLLAEINIYPKSRPKANISIVEQTVWTLWCKSKSKMKMKENKEVRTIHSLNISSVSEVSTGKQEHSFFFFLWNGKLLKSTLENNMVISGKCLITWESRAYVATLEK